MREVDSMKKQTEHNPFGRALGRFRESKGLTQTQLAQMCGMRQTQISQIEGGHNSNLKLETMLRICNALGAKIDEILCFNGGEK